MAFPVFVDLQLQHLLFGDVVGDHPLGGALGGQPGQVPVRCALPDVVLLQDVNELGEGGGDPDAGFILDALAPLQEHFLDDHRQVLLFLLAFGLVQIHEHGDEGGLTVGGHEGDHLILNGVDAPADLLSQPLLYHLGYDLWGGGDVKFPKLPLHSGPNLLPAHLDEGGQVGEGNGLATILVGGYLGDDLGGDVAGSGEGVGLFNHGAGDDGAVLQHVLQVYQVAIVHVLGVIVRVVEVDDAGLMGLHDFFGQQNPPGDVFRDLASHVIPLNGIHRGVFIGVFLLDFLVVAFDEGENPVIGGVGLPDEAPGVAVSDVLFGHLKGTVGHNGLFY